VTSRCVIPEEKVRDYLLNSEHLNGSGKAAFFVSQGFSRENFTELSEALKEHYLTNDLVEVDSDEWGIRFECKGLLKTPSGKNPIVISAWIQGPEDEVPRLVSAYPA